jgi:hypothetical protein
MPMAMRLVFSAMAEQGHRLILGEMLQEAQGEFLAVILDSLISPIERAAFAHFLAVSIAEFGPGDCACKKFAPELLTRTQICHPNIETVVRQTPAAASRRENSETVLPRLDLAMNRLRLEHNQPRSDRPLTSWSGDPPQP